jgi:parvulin-like peptidyl-prolyl isomerase
MMPDGSPVPALAPSAPERIKLGVAIFRYKGTQGSSDSSRSREAALALAQEATKVGQTDFASAVKKGDRGSSENIGWIDQRILERAVEYAVFSLEKGEISKTPIDTPRGFWVAKRLR